MAMPSERQRIEEALEVADRYGGIDGGHHKAWVIDQMVRNLCGTTEEYQRWVGTHVTGEDGPFTYSWDEGIAP